MKKLTTISMLLLIFCYSGCGQKTTKSKPEAKSQVVNSTKKTNELKYMPVLLSKDFGKTWQPVSQGLPDGVQVTFMEAKGREIVLASDNLGVFITENQRTQWKQIGEKLPGKKINALHVSGNIIYAGVYKQGLFKTNNEGQSWESLNLSLPSMTVQSVWSLGDKILAGTDEGLFILAKGAKSWQPTNIKVQVLSIYEYEKVLVIGTSQGTVISRDQGENWTWVRKQGAVHYTHNVGKRMVEFNISGDLFYSDDFGKNWTEIAYTPREGSYIYEMASVGNVLLMSNNYGVHRSVDQGVNWELIYKTEKMAFFDFLTIGNEIYGGMRLWDEYRKRK